MDDWKLILKVIIGSVLLMLVVIYGLSKMANTNTTLTTDQNILTDGAKLVKENGETKVTVVNFSDMECPACKLAHELTAGLASIPEVKVVFRHYPLAGHKNSFIAAVAVEAARVMGKGWEMIDILYANQEEWSGENNMENKLIEYAKEIGLDGEVFKTKLDDGELAAVVQQDVSLGNSLRLSGTPTIYVNGEQVAANFVEAKVKELLK